MTFPQNSARNITYLVLYTILLLQLLILNSHRPFTTPLLNPYPFMLAAIAIISVHIPITLLRWSFPLLNIDLDIIRPTRTTQYTLPPHSALTLSLLLRLIHHQVKLIIIFHLPPAILFIIILLLITIMMQAQIRIQVCLLILTLLTLRLPLLSPPLLNLPRLSLPLLFITSAKVTSSASTPSVGEYRVRRYRVIIEAGDRKAAIFFVR
jgi:hypothetical protein